MIINGTMHSFNSISSNAALFPFSFMPIKPNCLKQPAAVRSTNPDHDDTHQVPANDDDSPDGWLTSCLEIANSPDCRLADDCNSIFIQRRLGALPGRRAACKVFVPSIFSNGAFNSQNARPRNPNLECPWEAIRLAGSPLTYVQQTA